MIKMLVTLLPATSGSATVAGYRIGRDSRHIRWSISYIPQMLSAEGSITGYGNLLVLANLYGIPRGEGKRRIEKAL